MKVLEISRFGGPEVLRLVEKPRPSLGPREVRVEVRAAGVNFADLMMRMGIYPEAPSPPFVPGYEVAGVLSEVGGEVRGRKVGERVFAGTRFGGYATEIVLSEDEVWSTPAKLSDEEAAAIPVNFLTAWIALTEMARVREGDRVLIHSAAGGVGTAAVQIAARAGARVVGLTGSPHKKDAILELGASSALLNSDYDRGSDSQMGGFDVILDPTGGASVRRSLRRLAPCGRVIAYGVSSMVAGRKRSLLQAVRMLATTPLLHPIWLMNRNRGVFGLNLLRLTDPMHRQRLSRCMEGILRELEAGRYRVVVGKAFPLAEGGAAQEHLRSRANVGKVVLSC